MIAEVSFRARDYQPIANIELNPVKDPVLGSILEENPLLKTILLKDFLDASNERLTARREDIDSAASIYISRGKDRSGKRISLFADFEDKNVDSPVTNQCLNGVVGALSGSLSYTKQQLGDRLQDLGCQVKLPVELDQEITFHVQLQIVSRFDTVDHAYFVSTLLTYGMVDMNDYRVYESQDDIFDFLLIDLLKRHLKEACKKGYYRTYRRFEKNDDRVRGSMDVARHIGLNMGQKNGRIAYSYRENSVDNWFNALILAAYRAIRLKYPDVVEKKIDSDAELGVFLNELKRKCTIEASNSKLIGKNNMPVAHPYFQEYEEVRAICLRILRDESVSIFDSDEGAVSGFLYYLPDLWETFLERVFEQSSLLRRESIYFKPQKSKKYLESNAGCLNESVAQPDFVFSTQKECDEDIFSILDAKMKPKWVKSILPDKKEVENATLGSLFGEDINKCIRDMAVFHSTGTGVIFPVFEEDERETRRKYKGVRYERRISNLNQEQEFYILPLVVPAIQGKKEMYESWKAAFQKSLSDFEKHLVEDVLLKSKGRYLLRCQREENARRCEGLLADIRKLAEETCTLAEMQQLRDILQKYKSGEEEHEA